MQYLDLNEFTSPPASLLEQPTPRPRTTNVADMYEEPFALASSLPVGEDASVGLVRSTHLQPTETAAMFFSRKNIDRVQALLRRRIKDSMGVSIDRQSDEQLQIVMRYVYMQSSANTGGEAEVARLNGLVLAEIAPQVAAGLAQYAGYLRDASRLPEPIPRGEATSIRGTKTAEVFRGI